jgi:uncharacterized membrane protein YjgN (DUF898 family)
MQLAGPSCKSCGAALGGPPRRPAPVAPAAGPRPPVPPSAGDGETPRPGPEGRKEIRRLTFHGTGGSLFGIHAVNNFLTVVTLGVYYFWGKVRVRRYLFGETEFEGDRFAFHGTGKELLLGTLKAVLVFFVPIGLLNNLPELLGAPAWARIVASLSGGLLFLVFIAVAKVGARRYRLSRTSWRGVRFSFRGKVTEFITLYVGGWLLTAVTLLLFFPFFEVRQYAFMVNHSRFGTQRFRFDGSGRELFGTFLGVLVLLPFTLGLSWFWYMAKRQRCLWHGTTLGEARFRYPVTGGGLFGLYAGNLFLLLFTFGFAWPWVVARTIRFTSRYLRLEGPLDLSAIRQAADEASATGEGLAGILDTDMGLGM